MSSIQNIPRSFLRGMFLLIHLHKVVAFQNLEESYQSLIERLRFFPKMFINNGRNVHYRLFAVDQRPDKATVFIQMDVGDLGLFQKLLGNALHNAFVVNFQGDDPLLVRSPGNFRVADGDSVQIIWLSRFLIFHW